MTDVHFELSYTADGIGITKYDLDAEPEPRVMEEWWYTWPEAFEALTGVEDHAPTVV